MVFDDWQVKIRVIQHISDIDADEWDSLSRNLPFQSHRWYQFGEQVMNNCQPFYLLAYQNDLLIGRAALWKIHNEPLPQMPLPVKKALTAATKKWPLMICRSPLSFTSGIVLADDVDREKVLSALSGHAMELSTAEKASFLVFDYLNTETTQGLPKHLANITGLPPGTIMKNFRGSLDEYLSAGNKKDRQHYKRTLREAEKFGIKIQRHSTVEQIEDALGLIRNVESNHGALPNPWTRQMLENIEMVNGLFITATIGERLVGCGLLLEDNYSQMTSLLGLANNVPYTYLMLVYESLKVAFEHKVRSLRWGSGAYEIKQRLGFSMEDNNSLAFSATSPFIQNLIRRFI
jgi:predicted N-acyltransferase